LPGEDVQLVAPLVACGAIPRASADECLRIWQALAKEGRPKSLLAVLVAKGVLTKTQAIVLADAPVVERQPFPNYKLLRRLDEGGMAIVYEGTYVPLQARVALKVLKTEYSLREAYRLRFKREANILLHLDHENIVEGREYATADGVDYYAMGFCEGISVLSLLDRGEVIGEGLALHVAAQVADALEHMRQRGIVHRDIKPGNLVLDHDGHVRIIDFGLAKVMTGMREDVGPETTVGTLEYMSPEQARGVADIDNRADVYSLGATLFHMVTGELPFTGTPEEIMYAHVKTELAFTPEQRARVSPVTRAILRRAMAKDTAARYPTPQAMADEIRTQGASLVDARGPVPELVKIATVEDAPIPLAPPRRRHHGTAHGRHNRPPHRRPHR
jgi:eukaryotic-like serine/threonine-protein kinase